MVSFKFILGLLSIISFLNSVLAVKHIDGWNDLPACAQLCLTFADGNGAPPGGDCSVLNKKCLCEEGLWRSIFSTCMRLGDPFAHAVPGCVNERAETIDAVLDWVSHYYCPTVNGTEQRPNYSSWSFEPATTAFTSRTPYTRSATSTSTISTSILTSVISSSTSTSIILDNSTITTSVTQDVSSTLIATTDDTSTGFHSTSVSTDHVTESTIQSSAPASATSTSGGGSLVYMQTTMVVSFWALVYLV